MSNASRERKEDVVSRLNKPWRMISDILVGNGMISSYRGLDYFFILLTSQH
jgi:hypothetical protein